MDTTNAAVWYALVAIAAKVLPHLANGPGTIGQRLGIGVRRSILPAMAAGAFGALLAAGDRPMPSLLNTSVGVLFVCSSFVTKMSERDYRTVRPFVAPTLGMLLYSFGSLYYMETGQARGWFEVTRLELLGAVVIAVAAFAFAATIAFRGILTPIDQRQGDWGR